MTIIIDANDSGDNWSNTNPYYNKHQMLIYVYAEEK